MQLSQIILRLVQAKENRRVKCVKGTGCPDFCGKGIGIGIGVRGELAPGRKFITFSESF